MTLSDSDTVLRQLAEQTIGSATEMSMAHVARAAIPAGVKAYLRANLRDRLRNELSQTGLFARVHSHSALEARLQDLFLLQSADGYVFPREEFLADLENAVRFTENYVCRPRWTLSSFLFHDAPVIATAMLFNRLEYLAEYAYLPQLLRRLVSQRKLQEIDRDSCTQLIRQIDASVVREHAPHELAMLARPIFRYFRSGEPGMTDPIPVQPVLLFFEDKELNGLRDHIQGICHVRGHEGVSLAELVELCEDYLVKPAAAPAQTGTGEIEQAEAPEDKTPPLEPDAGETPPAEASSGEARPVTPPAVESMRMEVPAGEALPLEAPSEKVTHVEARTDETVPAEARGDEAIHVGETAGEAIRDAAFPDGLSVSEGRSEEEPRAVSATDQPPAVDARAPESDLVDSTTPGTPAVEAASGGDTRVATDAGELTTEVSPPERARDVDQGLETAEGGHRPNWVAIAGSVPPETATGETGHGEIAPPENAVSGELEAPQEIQEEFAFDSSQTFSAPPVQQEVRHEKTVREFPPTPSVRTSPTFPDLRRMITEGQRKRFISVLCDRDADFYDLIVIRLNSMRTWHEASAYIRELFEINSIDPFKEEAITFTDIVQQRFETDVRSRQ